MPLAALLLLLVFFIGLPSRAPSPPSTQSLPAQQSTSQQTVSPSQSPTQAQTAAPPSSEKAPPASKKANAAHRRRSKKISPCHTPASGTTAAKSDPNTVTPTPPAEGTQMSAAGATAKDCPPPRIIVRQGGTKDPSIQLAGGPSPQESAQRRDAINQVLAATDLNLKKTAGMQLSAAQQDTVSQTREFMEQSKAAMADGDFERARTLAWKAQLLSEDLIKPEK